MSEDVCKGCPARPKEGYCCAVQPRKCPCINCLVKVMCTIPCDKWYDYDQEVNGEKNYEG